MDKQLFDDVIGEVPPSTVDVDAAIARGRRADRVRRVTNPAVAAGVAVVVLTGAIAFTTFRGDDGGGVGGIGNQPTTSSETSPEPPPTSSKPWKPAVQEACSRPDLESPAEIVSRLSAVAKAAVQAQRPGLQLAPNPATDDEDGVLDGALDFYRGTGRERVDEKPVCHKNSAFVAMATVVAPEGQTNILIIVTPDLYDSPDYHNCSNPSDGETCAQVTGPNGEVIAKKTLPQQEGRVQSRVNIVRPDGTRVSILVENVTTTASSLPLNHDQMIAIGTDPGMTLFP